MKKYQLFSLMLCVLLCAVSCSKSTKDIVKGNWKVSNLSMAGSPQDPELFGPFAYDLKEDGSYTYTEGTKKEAGKWMVSDDQKQLVFEPASGEKYSKDIQSASKDSVVLGFKSFTMDVKHTLVPASEQ